MEMTWSAVLAVQRSMSRKALVDELVAVREPSIGTARGRDRGDRRRKEDP